ncbi:MAG: hypothetical protein K8963_11500, partial [Proteobacteria bacterium]|nr:hypothetical protein [Pseudomonadota bacterium]
DVRFDRMDDRIDKVVEKVTELRVDFVRMDERITGMDERMDERMTRMEGTLKQMFEFMKEKARVSSSVPEAVPGETDISFDPDQDQPTMKPKEDQMGGKLGSHPNQLGSKPLTKQADVGPDVQPMQAGQLKPPHQNKGGGIGGPEGPPLE